MNKIKNYGVRNQAVNYKANNTEVVSKAPKKVAQVEQKSALPVAGTLAVMAGVKLANLSEAKINQRDEKIQNYLEKFDCVDNYEKIMEDLNKEPQTREIKALKDAALKKLLFGGDIRTYFSEMMQNFELEDAAAATINPNAKFDEVFYEKAIRGLRTDSEISLERLVHVKELLKTYPGVVEKMMSYKNDDGSQIFTPEKVGEFFLNCEDIIKNNPGAIFVKLESDMFKQNYQDNCNPSMALWRALNY